MVIQHTIDLRTDSRGMVFEPLQAAELAAQRNVHVVINQPGCIRGNHRHRAATEILTVQGPALVRWSEGGEVAEQSVAAGVLIRFVFGPGVAHAVKNTGSDPTLLVAFADRVHDPANPDIEFVELIGP